MIRVREPSLKNSFLCIVLLDSVKAFSVGADNAGFPITATRFAEFYSHRNLHVPQIMVACDSGGIIDYVTPNHRP